MADETNGSGPDWNAFLQGLGSGVVANNPGTLAVNTGVNLWNLGKAGYGRIGHDLGGLTTEQLPEMTDMASVPGSSEWVRHQLETNPESTSGLWGHMAGGLANIAGAAKAANKLVAGEKALNAPAANSPAWFRGKDTLPRWEINDQYAQMKAPLRPGEVTKLGAVLDHPELYDNYPGIAHLRVKAMAPDKAAQTGKGGYYDNWGAHGQDPETGITTIFVNPNLKPEEQRSTILHELQHNLQHKEGFTSGGSPAAMAGNADAVAEWARDVLKNNDKAGMAKIERLRTEQGIPTSVLIDPEKLRDHLYKRLGGEVEARGVQKRADMSSFERKKTPFSESQDTTPLAWEDVKDVVFGSGQ